MINREHDEANRRDQPLSLLRERALLSDFVAYFAQHSLQFYDLSTEYRTGPELLSHLDIIFIS